MATFESLTFYRGMSKKYPTDRPFVHQPRTNRRPRDSSQNFHNAADEWFLKRFGVPYRSAGVCVTALKLTAQAYAASPTHVMRVVPLTAYRYCWSPKVSDLLFKARELADAGVHEINAFLDAADYTEAGLEDAFNAGSEVMLHCERYIAVPIGLLPSSGASEAAGIILPFGA